MKKASERNKLLRDLTKHYFPGQNLRVAPEKLESLLLTLVRDSKVPKESRKHFFPTYNRPLDSNLLLYLPRKTLSRLDKSKNSYVKVLLSDDSFWARKLQYELKVTFPIEKPSYRSYKDQYKILKEFRTEYRQEMLFVLDFGPGTLEFLEEKFQDYDFFSSKNYRMAPIYTLLYGTPWACQLFIKSLPPNKPEYLQYLIKSFATDASSENLAWILEAHPEWAYKIWRMVADPHKYTWRRYRNLKEIKWILSKIAPQYKTSYVKASLDKQIDRASFKYLYENYPEIMRNKESLRTRLSDRLQFMDFSSVDFLLETFPEFFEERVLVYLVDDKAYEYLDKIGRLDLIDYEKTYKHLKDLIKSRDRTTEKTIYVIIETVAKRDYEGDLEAALREYDVFKHIDVLPELLQKKLFAHFAPKVSEEFRKELITRKLRYEAKLKVKKEQTLKRVLSYYPMSPKETEWVKKKAKEIWG